MTRLNVSKARDEFPDIVNRAAYAKERTIVSRRGKNLAAVIPIEDLKLLERLEREEMDRIDIADARAALKEAEEKGTTSLEDLMRELGDWALAYRVEVTPAAELEIRRLDPPVRKEVNQDILQLGNDPRPHGVQKLETAEKLYRVRVGPGGKYRAVYQIRDEVLVVLVVKVGHRTEVYRGVK
jgi:prevent-host-death family protein